MRILCLLNRELASNLALNLLLPAFRGHHVQVGLSERGGKGTFPSEMPPEARELHAAEATLPNDILFPLIERAGLPDDGLRHLTFAELERFRHTRVAPMPNPNSSQGLDAVKAFAPDLIVTIRYGVILKPPVIAVPRLGILNLHSGMLPAYRGILATLRALVRGERHIGCTLHYITDATIDTGPIVATARVPVSPERSLLSHVSRSIRPASRCSWLLWSSLPPAELCPRRLSSRTKGRTIRVQAPRNGRLSPAPAGKPSSSATWTRSFDGTCPG